MKIIDDVREKRFERKNPHLCPEDDEQLFCDLSLEEAARMVGGSVVQFENIQILESGAEKLCIYFDRELIWSASIEGRLVLPVQRKDFPVTFGYSGIGLIELYENCTEGSQGTKVDEFLIPGAAVFTETTELKRDDDSIYRLTYRIY